MRMTEIQSSSLRSRIRKNSVDRHSPGNLTTSATSACISRFAFVSDFGFRIACFVLSCFLLASASFADEATDFFEKKIRPVLAAKCYSCHSAEAAKKRGLKGGLQLDTRAGIRAGGESGPAVVPGDVAKSLIVESIRRESFEMPPEEKLSEDVIADFVRWIEMGAPDPREGEPVAVNYEIDYDQGRKHWAYQPLAPGEVPPVENTEWPTGPIDHYILTKIEQTGLQPAPDAEPVAMLRRLSFDLTGLPPTIEQVSRFETVYAADAPAAYDALVKELLNSPHFGEQWARHWLDGIRYNPQMETSAYYRNWVIKALNDDLPYNQFLRWQIAGDLLDLKDKTQQADGFTATQLIAYNGGEDDFVESSLEVLGQQIFGISFNCAKCHDHKFDAFSQEDYYALAGIFTSCEVPKAARDGAKIPGTDTQLVTLIDREPKRIGDAHFLMGGDKSRPGELVPRRLPRLFFDGEPPRIVSTEQSGRLELANWVGSENNVLAARVIVNRIWQRLVGRGIVPTPNDFGTNGDPPTHPELLDYLASRLMQEKWSLKAVIREVALSRTYRQSAEARDDSFERDQANELYTRAIPKRLQYEQIMDQLLVVADKLELGMVEPVGQINKWPQQRRKDKSYGGPRAIYCRDDSFASNAFDGPDVELLTVERARSVTAPQALHFLNSEMVRRLSEDTAARIETIEPSADPPARIGLAYRLLFARPPTSAERELGEAFLSEHGLKRYIHTLMCTNEFIHLN